MGRAPVPTKPYPLFCACIITLAAVCACATTRSPARYREDTHTLLYKRSSQLETCYAKALATNPNASGTIVVQFSVEARTGNIVKPTVDMQHSTAPQPLAFCVLDAVDGLTLAPPDSREGRATFVYAFGRLPAPSVSSLGAVQHGPDASAPR